MYVSIEVREKLISLEKTLWVSETRYDKLYLNNILDRDFFEFGKSGKTYDRHEILDSEYTDIDVVLMFNEGSIHVIEETVVLITYISMDRSDNTTCNRSSIWKNEFDEWKLYFHQGTMME